MGLTFAMIFPPLCFNKTFQRGTRLPFFVGDRGRWDVPESFRDLTTRTTSCYCYHIEYSQSGYMRAMRSKQCLKDFHICDLLWDVAQRSACGFGMYCP